MRRKIIIFIIALTTCLFAAGSNAGVSEMVRVPAGEFRMGREGRDPDEGPTHKVYLDEYLIDKYEVSNAEYAKCVRAGKCVPNQKYGGFTNPAQPVVGVDWEQADKYCKWAGKQLPTEAQWEKAAKGTDGRTYPWGENIDCSKANYRDCKTGKTKPVGSYPSGISPYGAMDMAGNVWEWTADWYHSKYYEKSPDHNPTGPESGKYRVLRGGGWGSYPTDLRTTYRYRTVPTVRSNLFGFRCVKNP